MNPNAARVLLVEDLIPVRELVGRLLREAGFAAIDEAGDGSVALEMLREVPYDLIITDWKMPRLDGHGLISAIRHWPEREQTPVLVLTGSLPDEAMQAGATDVVTKPFTTDELLVKVQRALDQLPS